MPSGDFFYGEECVMMTNVDIMDHCQLFAQRVLCTAQIRYGKMKKYDFTVEQETARDMLMYFCCACDNSYYCASHSWSKPAYREKMYPTSV